MTPINSGIEEMGITWICVECGEDSDEYEYPDGTITALCEEHATEAGFCYACRGFYGGTEEFMVSGIRGLCCECKDQLDEGDF